MIYESQSGNIRMVLAGEVMPSRHLTPFTEPDYLAAIELIRAAIDLFREIVNQALDEGREPQHILQRGRHVADSHLDRPEIMVRAYVPPDFPDRFDETRLDHVIQEPAILRPVPHHRG